MSVEYEDDKPVRVDTVVISTQHMPEIDHNTIEEDVIEQVIRKVIPERLMDENTKYLINPTGRFVIGGPQGDTGLTGRKNRGRYLRRICQTWRRSLFRKGSDEG